MKKQNNPKFDEFIMKVDVELFGYNKHLQDFKLLKNAPLRPTSVQVYDSKQSNGEVSEMLELWEMRSTPSLPSFQCPLWPGMAAPEKALSMGQIELNCLLMLNWITWFNCA